MPIMNPPVLLVVLIQAIWVDVFDSAKVSRARYRAGAAKGERNIAVQAVQARLAANWIGIRNRSRVAVCGIVDRATGGLFEAPVDCRTWLELVVVVQQCGASRRARPEQPKCNH